MGLKSGHHRVIDFRERVLPNGDLEDVIIVEANYIGKIMLIANVIVFAKGTHYQLSSKLFNLNKEYMGIEKHPYKGNYFEAVDQGKYDLPWDVHFHDSPFPYYSTWYEGLRKDLLEWRQSGEFKSFITKKELTPETAKTFEDIIDEL